MANNTNAQAISFCNAKVRPVADAVASAVLSMQTLATLWASQQIATIIPNDANFVQDGATAASGGTADGRPPITDAQVTALIASCNTIINQFTANSSALLNQFLLIQVNGRSAI